MKGDKSKKKKRLIENIIFCHKKLKEYKGMKYFILAPLFILVSVAVPLLFALLPSIVIKVLTSNFSVVKVILSVSISAAVLCIMQYLLKNLEISTLNERFLFRIALAKEFSEKTISIPYEVAESSEGKKGIQKALAAIYSGNDVGIEAIIYLTSKIIINILGLGIYAFITASLHPLLMILLIVCPIARLIVLKLNIRWQEEHKKEWTPLEVKLRYLEKESLDLRHGKDIRLYQIEKWFIKTFHKLIKNRLNWNGKEIIRKFSAQSVDRVMSLVRDISCYGYLIYQITQGMDISQFVLYLGIIGGFNQWIQNIFESYGKLLENNIIINDYREFMNMENYFDIGGNKSIPKSKTYTITLENVSFTYPGNEVPVFEDLNLTIRKGEKLAIVGVNGAGKSTLIKLICGLYNPQKGRILIDGIDIKEFNLKDYYDLYSVVFQDVFAFAFPLVDNITCNSSVSINMKNLNASINMAGLSGKINSLEKGIHSNLLKDLEDDGINLSGGEMQKLMLARALYKDAPIIILDEPTAALDPIAELEMYEKYNSFAKGKTSIFISHRLSSTVFCDRIIFLKNGKIVESGNHQELMRLKGEYANMYELQAHYYQEEVDGDVC